jgi:hypothetical protein
MNWVLRGFAAIIDLLQFLFFILFLGLAAMTPIGGGIVGGTAGATICYNASGNIVSGAVNAVYCAVVGAGIGTFAAPIGIVIDTALSCTFGVLLIFLLWVSGRFSFMAVMAGFGSEMLPGLNAFMPGWSLLVHRSIQQYKKVHTTATPRTFAFLKESYSATMPKIREVANTRAENRYANAPQSAREIVDHVRTPLKQFADGIRPANNVHTEPYAHTA